MLTHIPESVSSEIASLFGLAIFAGIGLLVIYLKRKLSAMMANGVLSKNIEANRQVYKLLVELRVRLQADRLAIFMFHNGDCYINGNSILKVSCAYEDLAAGISSERANSQGVLVSTVQEAFDFLVDKNSRKQIAVIMTRDLPPGYYKAVMNSQGVRMILKYPLLKGDKIIGMLCADYVQDDSLPVPIAALQESVIAAVPMIELQLNQAKTKTWLAKLFEDH